MDGEGARPSPESYRLQAAKRPETKIKRIKLLIDMLERGEKLHRHVTVGHGARVSMTLDQSTAEDIPFEAIDKAHRSMSCVTFRTPGCPSFCN